MSKDLTDALRQASGQRGACPGDITYHPKPLPAVADLPPIPARTGAAVARMPGTGGGAGASGVWMTADGIFTLVVD